MTNIIAAPPTLKTELTEKTLNQIDRVSWVTVIPDSLSCCVRTIFTCLDIFYHGFQWGVRSLPLVIKLTINQVPVGLVKRISSNIPEPSRNQTLIHKNKAKTGINSLLASVEHFYSPSKHAISSIRASSNSSLRSLENLVNLAKSRTVLKLGAASIAIFSVIGLSKYSGGLLKGLSTSTDQVQGWSSIAVAGLGLIAVIAVTVSARLHVHSREMESQLASLKVLGACEPLLPKEGILELRNNQLKEQNNQLKEQNNQLKEWNNQLQEESDELKEWNNQLQEENDELREWNNQLQGQNNQLQGQNNQLQGRIAIDNDRSVNFQELNDRYKIALLDLDEKSRYIKNLKDQLVWSQGEASGLKTKIQLLMSANNDLIISRKESQFDPNAILGMTEQQIRLFDDVCMKLGLRCSLSQEPFENPVSLINGQTYSKAHIDISLNVYNIKVDPNTRGVLPHDLSLTPNNIVDFLTSMVRIRAALSNPEGEDLNKFMKELPLIEIEEPVLVIKALSEALPVGITIPKADALSLIPNGEVDRYIIPNLILQSYNNQLSSYFNIGKVSSSDDHNGISEPVVIPANDHKAIRNQRLKYLSNQQPAV